MPECLISGVVTDLDGDVAADAQLTFTRIGDGVFVADGEVRRPNNVFVQADPNGVVSFSLLPGNYRGVMFTNRGARSFRIGVPEQATAAFADLVGAAVAVNAPSAVQTGYPTRAAFVAANAGTVGIGFADGIVVSAAGLEYRRLSGATSIADLPGWVPNDLVYPEHFGAVRDGVTDDAAAIQAAVNYSREVRLFTGTYGVGSTITADNCTLIGQGPIRSFLQGLSAVLPAGNAILRLGRSSVIRRLRLRYDTLTGSEARWERVGLDTRGVAFNLQRGSTVDEVAMVNCGTGISDFGNGVFSVYFGTIEIAAYSHAGIDLSGTDRTGNVFQNIYVGSSKNPLTGVVYTPAYGVRFDGREASCDWGQFNIEHAAFTACAARLHGFNGASISSLHIEGTDLTTAGSALIEVDESIINIRSLCVYNTRQTADNVSLIKLLSPAYPTEGGTPEATTNRSILRVDSMALIGISEPNGPLYPTYPSARLSIANVPGWKFIACSDTSRRWDVEIGAYRWLAYSDGVDSSLVYQQADTWYSDVANFRLLRWGQRGEIVKSGENLVANPAFSTWVNTSVTQSTAGRTEAATGWFIASTTGTLRGSRQDEGFGVDARTFLRYDNIGTAGTFQGLQHDVTFWREMFDVPLVLSFDARASVAGRRLEQITATLQNSGGSPTSLFRQIVLGTSGLLQFTTSWRRYRIPVATIASSLVTTFGSAPTMRLNFQINDATAARESMIDIDNVKLERGEVDTA